MGRALLWRIKIIFDASSLNARARQYRKRMFICMMLYSIALVCAGISFAFLRTHK
jgi:hypothetical protein